MNSSSKNKTYQTRNREALSWQKMMQIMNTKKLHKDPNKPLKQIPRARDEFIQIMEKLSMHVWQHYHPDENPYQRNNLKTIKEIAKSDYFADLICDALFMKDKGQ
jgi:Rps23 Pro-64 3,4-dihydroxylase Tpa1-like proline 4-hydroxylase